MAQRWRGGPGVARWPSGGEVAQWWQGGPAWQGGPTLTVRATHTHLPMAEQPPPLWSLHTTVQRVSTVWKGGLQPRPQHAPELPRDVSPPRLKDSNRSSRWPHPALKSHPVMEQGTSKARPRQQLAWPLCQRRARCPRRPCSPPVHVHADRHKGMGTQGPTACRGLAAPVSAPGPYPLAHPAWGRHARAPVPRGHQMHGFLHPVATEGW